MVDPPLYHAALAGDVPMLLSILRDDPSLLHRVQTTSIGDTIVHIAALRGHSEFIREITSHNPLLAREVNQQGCSPLHLASDKGQVQVMEELLHVAGADLCLIMDKGGRLPVHVAALAGKPSALEKLMEIDPDCLEKLTSRGETVLHCGVKANQMQVVQFLATTPKYIELLNRKDDKGSTVLHLAAARRNREMTRFLLSSSGVEVNATNKQGETPRDVILSHLPQGRGAADEVSEIIREAGGLSKDETGHAILNLPPPAATEETEESDTKWLKDMRKSLMVVAALIATVTFQAGVSDGKRDHSLDSVLGGVIDLGSGASPPSSVGSGFPLHPDYPLHPHYTTIQSIRSLEEKLYIAFLIFDMTSLFASLTVILLLLTKLPVKRQHLVVLLSRITHLAIFSVGSAFLLLAANNQEYNQPARSTLLAFWIGWSFVTCYFAVRLLEMAAGYFLRTLGMKPLPVGLASLIKWSRVIMRMTVSLVCTLVLLFVIGGGI